MPIYRPQVSPRPHPYGALKDITPEEIEGLFVPTTGYESYRVRVLGRYKIAAYVGTLSPPKKLHLFVTENGGESWERRDSTFPDNHIMESGFLDARYEPGTLWFALNDTASGSTVKTYRSENMGESWSLEWELSEPGFDFGHTRHRIFPTSGGIYQAATVNTPDGVTSTKLMGYKNGEKVLDQVTSPIITNNNTVGILGGLNPSTFYHKRETGFFAINFNSLLGGQEVWKISPRGFELRGKVGASLPGDGNPRPALTGIRYLPRKGVIYLATTGHPGARMYSSFDEGSSFNEQSGGVDFPAAELSTIGRKGIIGAPGTGAKFRNEGFMQDIENSIPWDDVLDAYGGNVDWDRTLESRLSRRGSRFYMIKSPAGS